MSEIPGDGASELEDSRDYRLLADSIPNLAWIAGPDGSIFWYNRRWYEYTGTSPAEMAGWGWQVVHDPATLPSVMVRWKASIATGQPFEMTFPLRGADGIFRPFLTRVLPSRDADGAVLRWFGTNTEVGDELRAAAALRESEERFRTATAAVSGVLWTNTAKGEMHGDQPAWSEFTGQTREQYGGYGWSSAVHPEDVEPTIEAWEKAVRDQRLFAFEHRVMRHDGIYRLCMVRALPIYREDGTVREWVGVHTDITAQKQAEEALRRNDKLAIAGRLASSIAHEINNPLDTISNLLYLLQGTELSEDAQGLCGMLAEELRRVAEIVNNTLRFQRQAAQPAIFRINPLLGSVQGLFAGRMRSLGICSETRLRATGELCGFEGEIRQVLANLVGNAADAMGDTADGARRLFLRTVDSVARSGKHPGTPGVRITVADTGPGMSPATLAGLFAPFFSTKGEQGTGLGLWISNEIVGRHEGLIRVRTRLARTPGHGGHGTVFSVFLPLRPGLKSGSTLGIEAGFIAAPINPELVPRAGQSSLEAGNTPAPASRDQPASPGRSS